MSFMDSPAGKWGAWGERIATQWLQGLGWFVVPTHLIDNGGAPKLVGHLKSHVLPDMQIAGQGKAKWVEVKLKDSPVLYQIAREWRHGIDLPKWNAYLQVESLSGVPGVLAIIQIKPGPAADPKPELLIASFERLRNVGQVGGGKDGPMMYWNVDWFEKYSLTDCQVPPWPGLRTVVHRWEQKSRDGRAPGSNDLNQPNLFMADEEDAL